MIDQRFERNSALLPPRNPGIAQVDGHAVQPGSQGQRDVDSVGILVQLQETILSNIFGDGVIPCDRRCRSVDLGVIAVKKSAQGIQILCPQALDELRVTNFFMYLTHERLQIVSC